RGGEGGGRSSAGAMSVASRWGALSMSGGNPAVESMLAIVERLREPEASGRRREPVLPAATTAPTSDGRGRPSESSGDPSTVGPRPPSNALPSPKAGLTRDRP